MSQRVWTCTCGWRSTAENVDQRRHLGEAPPHCRRCGKTQLRVTTEKHPKITHVCKGCGADFLGHAYATHCATCRTKTSRQKAWDGRRKYEWTPERDQLLRDHYNHNATAIAGRFFPGWPKWAIVKRAAELGLCRVKEQPWTKGEDAFLLEHAGTRTPHWMQKQLQTRTVTAIVVRLKRLNVSRRIRANGLTLSQLEQALGVDHRQIVAWWKSKRLKGVYLANPNEHDRYEFEEHDVAEFVLANPSLFRLDRVDQAWFMGLMRDAVARAVSGEGSALRKPTAKTGRSTTIPANEVRQCEGVDEDTPCPLEKTVQAKPGLPARCPDCMLALKRRLHSEERDRLKRIRASSAPAQIEELEEVGA